MEYKVAPDGTVITKRLEEINNQTCGQSILESYKDYVKDFNHEADSNS